ncbi:hypothetical protein HAX54_033132, partial [Datura stramonium]|nr:hypothetical protein [Datura stramonium]
ASPSLGTSPPSPSNPASTSVSPYPTQSAPTLLSPARTSKSPITHTYSRRTLEFTTSVQAPQLPPTTAWQPPNLNVSLPQPKLANLSHPM